MKALEQLVRQVAWEGVDVLVVDMPPGTGDTHLSLAQTVPLAGPPPSPTGGSCVVCLRWCGRPAGRRSDCVDAARGGPRSDTQGHCHV
jgi:hypothetical protein